MTRHLLLAAIAVFALHAEDFTGKVVAISDGDTIRVMHNGASERIRLWGIDAPESKQAFGTRATQFTADLAFGQTVTIEVHDVDRYKRTVAEIILPDGRNLNQEIVRAGFAWWYRQYARQVSRRFLPNEGWYVGRQETYRPLFRMEFTFH